MAINIPIISDFTDAGIKNARLAFQKFRTEVGQAEGAMGKFKAGSTAALDALKTNAASFATAGAVALTTFAAKSVSAFQDTALAADKFATATGLAVDDASRWLEVAGDMAVSSGSIESALGKMNKVLGTSPAIFKQLGVEIAKTETGATDVNKTFLNVIDRLNQIQDPAERARTASMLLGKGWQEMSQLIQAGSTQLSASLNEVSDAKVINESEVAKAKAFREAMDNLKDVLEDVSLTVGTVLVPILTAAIEAFKGITTAVGAAGSAIIDATGAAFGFGDAMGAATDETNKFNSKFSEIVGQFEDGQDRLEYYNARLGKTTTETEKLTYAEEQQIQTTFRLNDAWQNLLNTLDLESSFRDAKAAINELDVAAAEAFADPTKFDAYKDQQDAVIRKFAQIIEQMQLTDAEQNRIKFLVDTAPLDYALEALNRINLAATGQITTSLPRFGGARADGGLVMGGTAYLVGERGPEIFMPSTSGTIIPNMSSNSNITVNVSGADPNAVVRALQQYVRQSGPVPVNTRTM